MQPQEERSYANEIYAKFSTRPLETTKEHHDELLKLATELPVNGWAQYFNFTNQLNSKNYDSLINFDRLVKLVELNCDVVVKDLFRDYEKLGKHFRLMALGHLLTVAARSGRYQVFIALFPLYNQARLHFREGLYGYSWDPEDKSFKKEAPLLCSAYEGMNHELVQLISAQYTPETLKDDFFLDTPQSIENFKHLCKGLDKIALNLHKLLEYFSNQFKDHHHAMVGKMHSLREDLKGKILFESAWSGHPTPRCFSFMLKENKHLTEAVANKAFQQEDIPLLVELLLANLIDKYSEVLTLAIIKRSVKAIDILIALNPDLVQMTCTNNMLPLDLLFSTRAGGEVPIFAARVAVKIEPQDQATWQISGHQITDVLLATKRARPDGDRLPLMKIAVEERDHYLVAALLEAGAKVDRLLVDSCNDPCIKRYLSVSQNYAKQQAQVNRDRPKSPSGFFPVSRVEPQAVAAAGHAPETASAATLAKTGGGDK